MRTLIIITFVIALFLLMLIIGIVADEVLLFRKICIERNIYAENDEMAKELTKEVLDAIYFDYMNGRQLSEREKKFVNRGYLKASREKLGLTD